MYFSWGASLAKRVVDVDVFGIAKSLVVVQVNNTTDDAASDQVACHLPCGKGGRFHCEGLAELGFAGNFKAAVVAGHSDLTWRVEGPAAFGVFCTAKSLYRFA